MSDELRAISCTSKVPYMTRAEAKTIAKRTGDKFGGGKVEAYPCTYADHWHVGHATSKKRRKIALSADRRRQRNDDPEGFVR